MVKLQRRLGQVKCFRAGESSEEPQVLLRSSSYRGAGAVPRPRGAVSKQRRHALLSSPPERSGALAGTTSMVPTASSPERTTSALANSETCAWISR